MIGSDWRPGYLAQLQAEQEGGSVLECGRLGHIRRLRIPAAHWGEAARIAAATGRRNAGVWADPSDGPADPQANETGSDATITLSACLFGRGHYLVLETQVPGARPWLPSQTPHFPGVDRLERHCQDLTGVIFANHPHPHRWTRHQAWPEDAWPLRASFRDSRLANTAPNQARTPADRDYPFEPLRGSGIHEIPVGPVHAGIIEPGHFRFHAAGEDVLQLEERLGYVHRGIERLAAGRTAEKLARLAGRISGDSAVAHGWAACQAMEQAAHCQVPPRALWLRALLAERERIANHLGDIGAICNDVGFAFMHAQCARLRELWQRRNAERFGHRLLMDQVIPGGVARDLDAAGITQLRADHAALRRATTPLFDIVEDLPSLEDRLLTTGRLAVTDAQALGCTGYVGKASGQSFDVRRECPYTPYDSLKLPEIVEHDGDVAARTRVRLREVLASLSLLDQVLDGLPDGDIVAERMQPQPGALGLGIIDGWRGEILSVIRFGENGRVARFFPRDPSWFSWPALERLILGNIVPDFPVCNKSVNGSYAGVDL